MLPDPYEENIRQPIGFPFHESIAIALDKVKAEQKDYLVVMRTLCLLIIGTKIPQDESKVEMAFQNMIKRLGGMNSRRFRTNDRQLIGTVLDKLEWDVRNQTLRRKQTKKRTKVPVKAL